MWAEPLWVCVPGILPLRSVCFFFACYSWCLGDLQQCPDARNAPCWVGFELLLDFHSYLLYFYGVERRHWTVRSLQQSVAASALVLSLRLSSCSRSPPCEWHSDEIRAPFPPKRETLSAGGVSTLTRFSSGCAPPSDSACSCLLGV